MCLTVSGHRSIRISAKQSEAFEIGAYQRRCRGRQLPPSPTGHGPGALPNRLVSCTCFFVSSPTSQRIPAPQLSAQQSVMRVSKSPTRHRVCDRSISMPIPTTPSARFARDATAGAKAQVWVEEVIQQRLPGGDFATAFRDGQGLCHLVNAFQPGTISKVETSTSPFKQMANISAFIQACRTLGVREHALFETLVSTYCC